jgi:signal transduction histidine kinase
LRSGRVLRNRRYLLDHTNLQNKNEISLVPTASKQKDDFPPEYYAALLAGLIHKLNNVITVLSGHTGLMLLDSDLEPEIADPIQQMAKATQTLSKYIDESAIVARPTPISRVRLDALQVLSELEKPGGVKVSVESVETEPVVYGDKAKLSQIFAELLKNAATAGARKVTIKLKESAESVVFSFRDNGSGMRPEVLSRAFDPFFTTRKHEAFGLGLFRVKGELSRMRGKVEATSDARTFTEIRVTLPKA